MNSQFLHQRKEV